MTKVVRRVITYKYAAMRPDVLAVGHAIPFDVYIKRYRDFVIILEAGTFLDEALHAKIMQHESVYVMKSDAETVRGYRALHAPRNPVCTGDPVASALSLRRDAAAIADEHERLAYVYGTVSDLIRLIFESGGETLYPEALRACSETIAQAVRSDTGILPMVLKLTPQEYSIHHHSVNVAFFAAIVGTIIDVGASEMEPLTLAALVHDIGKLRIDPEILDKPESLEEEEYEIIKRHSIQGCELLEQNGITDPAILKGVRYHHERLDGSGYPEGLKGKMIPKIARIIGMCDAFDALTTQRTFRKNYTSFEALMLMKKEMKTQFDEKLVDGFIHLHR